ncbi:MAG: hypothetical protein K2K36_02170, partial [Muribaculaceae bacterium]|nr:hypothetical protein [Muribaculaceae bacterium]
ADARHALLAKTAANSFLSTAKLCYLCHENNVKVVETASLFNFSLMTEQSVEKVLLKFYLPFSNLAV